MKTKSSSIACSCLLIMCAIGYAFGVKSQEPGKSEQFATSVSALIPQVSNANIAESKACSDCEDIGHQIQNRIADYTLGTLISSAALGFFSLVLSLVAIFFTWYQAKKTRDTTLDQLRAYVSLTNQTNTSKTTSRFVTENEVIFSVYIEVVNSGQTPAREVSGDAKIKWSGEGGIEPKRTREKFADIGKDQTSKLWFKWVVPLHAVLNGTGGRYYNEIEGVIAYKDIFNRHQITPFAYKIIFPDGKPIGLMWKPNNDRST